MQFATRDNGPSGEASASVRRSSRSPSPHNHDHGHSGIRGNEVAHAMSRVSLPGPPLWWPDSLKRNELLALARLDRRERLDEMRNNRRVYPDPPHSMMRREAALVRRAQTHSLMTPHIEHYIQGKDGSPSCVACGGFPGNAHVLWKCPGARAAMGENLKHIPTRPATLEEWLADSSPDVMKALLRHLTLLGLSEGYAFFFALVDPVRRLLFF
ncbi:hypothetical protein HPB50_007166 [Hyalomma asiaticum]|uniref:Uncharacterized protein n=1 Tax=Hyalomma asiaticum TaxID=266040 RepID=A0ACB7SHA3_HYAAI|nr:hypothetical protein HPB50_007166 [Hyalomma asiaticum]